MLYYSLVIIGIISSEEEKTPSEILPYIKTARQIYYEPSIEKINDRTYKVSFDELGYIVSINSNPISLEDVELIILPIWNRYIFEDEGPQYWSESMDNYVFSDNIKDSETKEIQYFDIDNDGCFTKGDFLKIINITLSDGSKNIEGYYIRIYINPNCWFIDQSNRGDLLIDENPNAILINNYSSTKGIFIKIEEELTIYKLRFELSTINELSFNTSTEYNSDQRVSHLSFYAGEFHLSLFGAGLLVTSHEYYENHHHYTLSTVDKYDSEFISYGNPTWWTVGDFFTLHAYDIYNNETIQMFEVY